MEECGSSGELGWTRSGGRKPAPSHHISHFPSIRRNVFTSYRTNVNWRGSTIHCPPTLLPTLRHVRYIPLTNARLLTEYSPTGSTGAATKNIESTNFNPPPIPTNTNLISCNCSKIYPSAPITTRELNKYVSEIIEGGLVCILIFTSERKREREKNIYVQKERNKRKIVSGSDGMQATPHRLPLLVLSEKIKEKRGKSKKERWKLITFQRFSTWGKESRGLSLARIIACRGS